MSFGSVDTRRFLVSCDEDADVVGIEVSRAESRGTIPWARRTSEYALVSTKYVENRYSINLGAYIESRTEQHPFRFVLYAQRPDCVGHGLRQI